MSNAASDARAANVSPTFAIQIWLRNRYTSARRSGRKEQDLRPAIRFGCARGARSLVSMQIALLHKLEWRKMGWRHSLMFDTLRVRNAKRNPINIACPDKIYQPNNRSCQEIRDFASLQGVRCSSHWRGGTAPAKRRKCGQTGAEELRRVL